MRGCLGLQNVFVTDHSPSLSVCVCVCVRERESHVVSQCQRLRSCVCVCVTVDAGMSLFGSQSVNTGNAMDVQMDVHGKFS